MMSGERRLRKFSAKRKRTDDSNPAVDRELSEPSPKRQKEQSEKFISFIYSPWPPSDEAYRSTYLTASGVPWSEVYRGSEDTAAMFKHLQQMDPGFFADIGHLREAMNHLATRNGIDTKQWLLCRTSIKVISDEQGGRKYDIFVAFLNNSTKDVVTVSKELTLAKYKLLLVHNEKDKKAVYQPKIGSCCTCRCEEHRPWCPVYDPTVIPTCACGFERCISWCPRYDYDRVRWPSSD
jgi:hypothetical protein